MSELFPDECPYAEGDEVLYGDATWTVTDLIPGNGGTPTIVVCDRDSPPHLAA